MSREYSRLLQVGGRRARREVPVSREFNVYCPGTFFFGVGRGRPTPRMTRLDERAWLRVPVRAPERPVEARSRANTSAKSLGRLARSPGR